ncbi:zinc finger protein [Crotalus adamanteus]|uniref:Zinc finger protein n=1 Tax=Crotalus adamanteus TaxID=8729 RepID=A0AAW1BTW4_CROAD
MSVMDQQNLAGCQEGHFDTIQVGSSREFPKTGVQKCPGRISAELQQHYQDCFLQCFCNQKLDLQEQNLEQHTDKPIQDVAIPEPFLPGFLPQVRSWEKEEVTSSEFCGAREDSMDDRLRFLQEGGATVSLRDGVIGERQLQPPELFDDGGKTAAVSWNQRLFTLVDVEVHFTEDEWVLLEPDQKALHRDVMEEISEILTSLGDEWRIMDKKNPIRTC